MKKHFALSLLLAALGFAAQAQPIMNNPYSRQHVSLGGEWQTLIDVLDCGTGKNVYKNLTYEQSGKRIEYSFDELSTLSVPGDWNSQRKDLWYFEGTVWYKKDFNVDVKPGERQFLYFGAANYFADVYLNGELVGSHEGGFTPFEFEITDKVKNGANFVIVRVNAQRTVNGIPSDYYDWWNYGGLTRDVLLITTGESYLRDYFVRLDNNDPGRIAVRVKADRAKAGEKVKVEIPALKIEKSIALDAEGKGEEVIKAKPQLWSPDDPVLYDVNLSYNGATVSDRIGFRTIKAENGRILLNGKPVFLKGVNCHEEISTRSGKPVTDGERKALLDAAQELGCNFIRLTHYPHSERMIRMAEERGIMLWEEIPQWGGHMAFSDPTLAPKGKKMMEEMIERDKNRCSIILWSVANETVPSPDRDRVLTDLAKFTREKDNSRLVTAAFNNFKEENGHTVFSDNVAAACDVIGMNRYNGWYHPYTAKPEDYTWDFQCDKPIIVSEFGAGAKYGVHGDPDCNGDWNEECQEKIYKDNLVTFENIKNLCGVTPWCMIDFRSAYRFNHKYQNDWNKKGLLSDRFERKKAWYVLKKYYESK